mmetsp:Transcript_7460/g.9631  ORF Transcript_7460/g.9631 Transcript_7460/m.9631 type:complete len:264 (-) Transcript_7460:439-1230(-)
MTIRYISLAAIGFVAHALDAVCNDGSLPLANSCCADTDMCPECCLRRSAELDGTTMKATACFCEGCGNGFAVQVVLPDTIETEAICRDYLASRSRNYRGWSEWSNMNTYVTCMECHSDDVFTFAGLEDGLNECSQLYSKHSVIAFRSTGDGTGELLCRGPNATAMNVSLTPATTSLTTTTVDANGRLGENPFHGEGAGEGERSSLDSLTTESPETSTAGVTVTSSSQSATEPNRSFVSVSASAIASRLCMRAVVLLGVALAKQ